MPNGVKWCKNRREDVTLTGTFFHNVDKKDRIFIPAKIREELGLSFVMSIPFDGQPCISIYTKEYWDSMKQRIDALPYQEKMLRIRGNVKQQSAVDVRARPVPISQFSSTILG